MNITLNLPRQLELAVQMMSDGRMMQKTDLAVKMVKTSPRGRNLRAAMLVKNRNPVKNPRVTTRSFSLKVF
jgi:hypothetical protein